MTTWLYRYTTIAPVATTGFGALEFGAIVVNSTAIVVIGVAEPIYASQTLLWVTHPGNVQANKIICMPSH